MQLFEPRKKPVQRRSIATVEAILEATARVLLRKGFDALTTTAVAEVAGVGVGTLYQYFPSKEALLRALLEEDVERFQAVFVGALHEVEGAPLRTQLEAMIDATLRYKSQHGELIVALRSHMPRVDGARVMRATSLRLVKLVAAVLAPYLPDTDLELTTSTLVSAMQGTIDVAFDLAPSRVKRPAFRAALVSLAVGYLREAGCTGL